MSGPQFFQTVMGRQFYEGTMPRLVKQLEKLNDNLERLGKQAAVPEKAPAKPAKRDIVRTLLEVEDALKNATPGPWVVGKIKPDEAHIDFPKGDKRIGFVGWTNAITCWGSDEDGDRGATGEVMRANAHLVANAPRWLRELADEVRRLKEARDE